MHGDGPTPRVRRGGGWSTEVCPASIERRNDGRRFACQRDVHVQGGHARVHDEHRFQGEIDGRQLTITWKDVS